MDKLFTNISRLLNNQVRLIEHTALTQNEVGKDNVVLWNKSASLLDSETYTQFKDALKKRQHKYTYSHILPYSDFCIAILCSLEYSLNHKVTVGIPDKTFNAAWRSMEVISATSTSKVSKWIKEHMNYRTAVGYCNALEVTLNNPTTVLSSIKENKKSNNNEDIRIIDSIDEQDTVTVIHRYNEGHDHEKVEKIHNSMCTSEGSLYDLEIAHISYSINSENF